MSLITIVTPTYNRSKKLLLLYESLQKQSNMDFEWLIVDDGSTDDTEDCIARFYSSATFQFRYIKKENGGKHTALNIGIKEVDSPLTFIVDSDDVLLPNAIELISCYYQKYSGRKDIGAFAFLKCNSKGESILKLEQDEFVESYIKYRIRGDRPGDMAEVFYTDILLQHPFSEFKGEKFLSEDVVWIQIGLRYKFVFINRAIYQYEYQSDGLTASDKPIKFASPQGSMFRGKMLMQKECGIKANIKGAIIYNCYKRELNSNNIPVSLCIKSLRDKLIIIVTKPLGVYFHQKWKA